jgi:putative ABC transport system substrate-binding protein
MVPLQASSMKDIPLLLEKALVSVDCIWLIPDKTVISESIAQYIIKQAVIKRIPVIGYNQFFYESGAAMSFVFDYGALGRQAGQLAAQIVARQTPCERQIPVFEAWLNGGVIEKLGIRIPDALKLPMKMGP